MRYYMFTLPDGSQKALTIDEALEIDHPIIKERLEKIGANLRNVRSTKDAFQPGWQENIQENISTYGQYKKRLKQLGLVEIGKDFKPTEKKRTKHVAATKEFAMEAKKKLGVSDRMADAIESGEYFKGKK